MVSVGIDAKAANFPVGVVENGEMLPVQFGSPNDPPAFRFFWSYVALYRRYPIVGR